MTHTTTVHGKCGISATVILQSVPSSEPYPRRIDKPAAYLTTFEWIYPRFILSEANTHRMLAKSSASSRAIPMAAMHEHIINNTATPVHWGKNQPGMSAKEELSAGEIELAMRTWNEARDMSITFAQRLVQLNVHKQIVNRLTEAFMMMKTVVTGTEYANLWWLRDHDDAQPEFHELARCAHEAIVHHTAMGRYEVLSPGQWHLPYVDRRWVGNELVYSVDGQDIDLETGKKVSASCCAQTSYRKNDGSIEKAESIFAKLIESEPVHASPFEHQATPMPFYTPETRSYDWPVGMTHIRRDQSRWSGNLREWIQYRQLIPNNAKWD